VTFSDQWHGFFSAIWHGLAAGAGGCRSVLGRRPQARFSALIGRLVFEVGDRGCGQGPTRGGPADGLGLGDLAQARPGFASPVGVGEEIWGDDGWPASASSTGPSGGQADVAAFSDEGRL
jgi:hypothetical protein